MRSIIAVLLSFVFILYSCGLNHSADNSYSDTIGSELSNDMIKDYSIGNNDLKILLKNKYDINTDIFENKDSNRQINIHIQYPQIFGFYDATLQDSINELIKDAALRPYFEIKDSLVDGTDWPINYSVMYATDKLLSIRFEGYIFAQGSAHGTNWVYSINIDLDEGQILNTNNLFNDTFKDKLNSLFFVSVDVDTTNSDESAICEMFNRFQDNFANSDNNFYFTADKLVIILSISDYYQFAAAYQNLKESMNEDSPVWAYVLSNIN